MKINKILTFFTLLLTIFSIFTININSSAASEYEYITTSKGTFLTYRGTDIKVEVPTNYTKQTTEFRGVWVSPYAGDISGYVLTQESFQNELLSVLDNMEKYNLNAIIFHLRTHNDALYDTRLSPMSSYVKAANFKKWDYLPWFIEECHNRGIEFHAWLNPYRISSTSTTMKDVLSKYDSYRSNPARKQENVLIGSSGAILDPGRPEVKDFLVDVCMEIVEKYDVDAIHFDDYFYIEGVDDSDTYNKYKSKYDNVNIQTFRRLQVDDFIEKLSNKMYEYNIENNRTVQLGISPSGVYRNGTYNTNYKYDENGTLISPVASNTAGYAHYDAPLYSDTKKWIDNEWIDYITPQLYGSFESTGSCYADAVDWWAQVVKYKKVNLYTGLGIYKSLSDKTDSGWSFKGNRTLELQLKYNQKHEQVDGFCLYQYRTIRNGINNNSDFKNVFNNLLTNKALTPKILRYNNSISEVSNLKLVKGNNNYTLLFDNVDDAVKYAIYKSSNDNIDINDYEQLLAVVGKKEINSYIMEETNSNYTYGVVAINQGNEKSNIVTIKGNDAITKIDFDFAQIPEITLSNKITFGQTFTLNIKKANTIVGEEVQYKIYQSKDQIEWELVNEIKTINSLSTNVSLKLNDYLKPEYIKIVLVNEFGEIKSDIIKIDSTTIEFDDILKYAIDDTNKIILEIFKIN